MEAIVLAGGFGTRLRSVVSDVPKPMAPVNGRPFLAYVLDQLADAGFETAVLAVGYKNEVIRDHFGRAHGALALRYSTETAPLGTGGAIKLALGQTQSSEVFVLNGDTYLALEYQDMAHMHREAGAELTVAVHAVPDTGRYGALDIEAGRIRGFFEKGRAGRGYINAGVYLMTRSLVDRFPLPRVFSFEADLLTPHIQEINPCAFEASGIFIDIGVPDDYAHAQGLLGSTPTAHRIGG
jgi:D-glycero-alpha-D-manno-heptose 1-phosphate guanylyltransferase